VNIGKTTHTIVIEPVEDPVGLIMDHSSEEVAAGVMVVAVPTIGQSDNLLDE
jgi:hypothetical protein